VVGDIIVTRHYHADDEKSESARVVPSIVEFVDNML
jgi:hypothetical protein